ncbi:phosphotransferase enzyme family protein [Formosa sp. S-31]|uniref:phosphotransferase enzyme family protein n=1 Tax=Formosa sp. S-31 TaxID=2790949 RepID=UPI003EB7980D
MEQTRIEKIFNQFNHNTSFKTEKELISGHINDSYVIETQGEQSFVLQRINHNVFKDVPRLINNKILVSAHLKSKFKDLSEAELSRKVLSFVACNDGAYFYRDETGNYWNLSVFVSDSFTHDVVDSETVAYEGGKLFGAFLNLTSDFNPERLIEVIPDFHDMSFRFSQFEAALKQASEKRMERAKFCIDKVFELKEEMHILQHLKTSGQLKLRVTHNDTKISNALFDKNDKGLCVIDTDTVMPGIIHYDFGDAIRTICNTAAEDETNLDLVTFNVAYYKAYKKGFLETMGETLSPLELKYLPLGAKTMTFIMALRFLTDYLNNDIYYKTAYSEHNLNRSKNQFKLIQSFSEQLEHL